MRYFYIFLIFNGVLFVQMNCSSLEKLPIDVFKNGLFPAIINNAIYAPLDGKTSRLIRKETNKLNNSIEIIVDLSKKKVYFPDIINLSSVSKKMSSMIESCNQSICEYWFQNRVISSCPLVEARFQWDWFTRYQNMGKKAPIYYLYCQTPYLEIVKQYRKRGEEERGPFCDSYQRWYQRGYTAPDFLFGMLVQELLNIYAEHSKKEETLAELNNHICTIFAFKNLEPINLEKGLEFLFVVLTSLGFLMTNSNEENVMAIKSNFIDLYKIFNRLKDYYEQTTAAISDDRKKKVNLILKTVAHSEIVKFCIVCDSDSKKRFKTQPNENQLLLEMEGVLNILEDDFEKFITPNNYRSYTGFLPEQKLAFIYLNLKDYLGFPDRSCIPWLSFSDLFFRKTIAYFARKNVDFCVLPLFNFCTNTFPVVAALLSLYSLENIVYLFREAYDVMGIQVEIAIIKLLSLSDNASYQLIAKYFFLFLKKDWQDQFERLFEKDQASLNDSNFTANLLISENLSKREEFRSEIRTKEGREKELKQSLNAMEIVNTTQGREIAYQAQQLKSQREELSKANLDIKNIKKEYEKEVEEHGKTIDDLKTNFQDNLLKIENEKNVLKVEKENQEKRISDQAQEILKKTQEISRQERKFDAAKKDNDEALKKTSENHKKVIFELENNLKDNFAKERQSWQRWRQKFVGFFIIAQLIIGAIYALDIPAKLFKVFKTGY